MDERVFKSPNANHLVKLHNGLGKIVKFYGEEGHEVDNIWDSISVLVELLDGPDAGRYIAMLSQSLKPVGDFTVLQ